MLFLATKNDSSTSYRDLKSVLSQSARTLLEYQDISQFWSHPFAIKSLLLQQFHNGHQPSEIRFVEHHLAHAAGSYLQSPFENAVAVVADGVNVSSAKHEVARILGIPPRDAGIEIDSIYKDVAAAAQDILENELLALVQPRTPTLSARARSPVWS